MKRFILRLGVGLAALASSIAPLTISVGTLSLHPQIAQAIQEATVCKDGTTAFADTVKYGVGSADFPNPNNPTNDPYLPQKKACGSHGFVVPKASTPTKTPAGPTASPAPGTQADCESHDGVWLSLAITAGTKCVVGKGPGGVIIAYITLILQFLAGLVGAVILLMLIIAGLQYLTSTGDPGQVKAAKDRITNAITALVLFAFMYAILNFLIPGGIFK